MLCVSETVTIQSQIQYLKESILDLEKRIELLHGVVRTPTKVLNEGIFLKEGNPNTCIQGNPNTWSLQGIYIEKIKDSMNGWIAWITPILLPSAKFIIVSKINFMKYLCKTSFDFFK